jgi:hypothetical protein
VFHVAGLAPEPGTLTGNCGDNPGIACRLTWDITHSTNATQLVRVYLAGPVTQALRILFVVVIALLVRAVAHRVINKITERAATTSLPVAAVAIRPGGRRRAASAAPPPPDDTTAISAAAVAVAGTERREQRARALGSILRSRTWCATTWRESWCWSRTTTGSGTRSMFPRRAGPWRR